MGFTLYVNGEFQGEFTCREMCAMQIIKCARGAASVREQLDVRISRQMKFATDPQPLRDFMELYHKFVPDTTFEVTTEQNVFGLFPIAHIAHIDIHGVANQVYWSYWWASMALRLICTNNLRNGSIVDSFKTNGESYHLDRLGTIFDRWLSGTYIPDIDFAFTNGYGILDLDGVKR